MWPNQYQLLVAIGAEQLCLVLRKGFAKKIIAKHYESYQQSNSEQPWKVAIQQLNLQFEALNPPKNTQISLTLASDLVRYVVLPGHMIAMSSVEKRGYAEAAYREIYGATADGWKISIDDNAPTQPTLAAAIDMAFYEAIAQLCQKYQLKLSSVQPYLMTAFNTLFSSINKINASFVIIEQTRIATLQLQNGVCEQVQVEKLTSDWQTNLEQSLSRNQLLTNQNSKELLIYAPSLSSNKLDFSKIVLSKRLSVNKKSVLQSNYAMLETLV